MMSDDSWMDDGACVDEWSDMWFADRSNIEVTKAAKRICNGYAQEGIPPCPVRAECQAFAMKYNIDHGVWGGLTVNERRNLRRSSIIRTNKKGTLYE